MGYYQDSEEFRKAIALNKYWESGECNKWVQGYFDILKTSEYPLAYCQIGYAYLEGIGVEKDLVKAFEYTKKGAELGDRDAQYNIGTMYEDGVGVNSDIEQAKIWYKKAALQERDLAIQKLKSLFENNF